MSPYFLRSFDFSDLFSAGTLTTTDSDGVVNVYNNGDIAWTLASTALVWIMVPGVGYLYSGLLRRKNALGQIYMSLMVLSVVSFQVRMQYFPFDSYVNWFI